MLSNPREGARVVLCYGPRYRPMASHNGQAGSVVRVGRGKPRNHLIRLDSGELVVVPAGNLERER